MWTQGLFYSFHATLWAWSPAGIVIFKISFLISWVVGCQNDKRILHLPFCNSTNDLGTQSYCEIGTFPCHNLLQFMYNSCSSYSTLHSFNLIWNCEMWTQEQDTIAKEKCGLVIYFAKKNHARVTLPALRLFHISPLARLYERIYFMTMFFLLPLTMFSCHDNSLSGFTKMNISFAK